MPQQECKATDQADEKSQLALKEPTIRRFQDQPGILVVDDDPLVRELLELCLELNGFQVWLASNGREAIDRYQQYRKNIDIVLLDVCMPVMNGPQTLAALRELDSGVQTCFMSASMGVYEAEELRKRGAGYVFVKPFKVDELVNILRLLIHNTQAEIYYV